MYQQKEKKKKKKESKQERSWIVCVRESYIANRSALLVSISKISRQTIATAVDNYDVVCIDGAHPSSNN